MPYKNPEKSQSFNCELCDYITINKKDFNKHLDTIKHKNRTNPYNSLQNPYKNPQKKSQKSQEKKQTEYLCDCGKKYKHRQTLHHHRKKCDFKNEKSENNNNIKNNEIIFEKFDEILEKSNEISKDLILNVIKEQAKIFTDLIPKIGNNIITTNNNTNTNTNSNNVKQNFNVNVFLNENCKDAISLNDFVKKIEVSVNDLLFSKEKGLIKGISNLFIKNLNELPMIQRPLWCSDKKRKKIYVKEESWTEDVDNNKTKEAIYNISKAQTGNINKYIQQKPNWMADDTDKATYIDIVKTVTEEVDDGKREKVIDTIMETIHLTEDKVG